DKKILKVISQNARMSIVDISKKIKKPVHITNYHLKRLIKAKIIEGFKPKININKLGYQWHLLLLQLQNLSEQRKKQFIEFCKQNKKIYYITNTIGNYNVMLDLHVKSSEEFKEVLLELKDKFSDIIKLYESMVIFDEYKIDYVPKTFI
ncbi:MAG: Lrp/AsnC family transcriptional regulator, partial [Nanoarchaeota archaeon]|nr:Lrp/AsnC family transcriptional regulator [Nanoarchaeota archaeon]